MHLLYVSSSSNNLPKTEVFCVLPEAMCKPFFFFSFLISFPTNYFFVSVFLIFQVCLLTKKTTKILFQGVSHGAHLVNNISGCVCAVRDQIMFRLSCVTTPFPLTVANYFTFHFDLMKDFLL